MFCFYFISAKGAHFSGNNVIEYKANGILNSLPNGIQDISFNFVSNGTSIKIFDVRTNNSQRFEFGLEQGQAYLATSDGRSILKGFLSDEQSHKVIISPSSNSVSIDGVSNTLVNIPSILDSPTVQIGSSSNDALVSMCVYNVSFVGIPIMAYAFSDPRNLSVTMISNTNNQDASEATCVSGSVKTPAPTIKVVSTASTYATTIATRSSNIVTNPPYSGLQAGGIVGIVIGILILLVIMAIIYIRYVNVTTGEYPTETENVDNGASVKYNMEKNSVATSNGRKEWFL